MLFFCSLESLATIGMYRVELIFEMLCVLENVTQVMNEEDNGNVHSTSVVGQGDWWQMVDLHFIDLDAGVSTRLCGLFAKVRPWPSTWPHGLWSTRVRKVRSQLDRSHTTHNILQANPKFKCWAEALHSQKMKDSSLSIASILCDDSLCSTLSGWHTNRCCYTKWSDDCSHTS